MDLRSRPVIQESVSRQDTTVKLYGLARPEIVSSVATAAFGLFLFLALVTPAWRVGPFTWMPVWSSSMLAGDAVELGLLSLLPIVCLISLLVIAARRRSWQFGPKLTTIPLSGLSLFVLASLEPNASWRSLTQAVGVGLVWLIYLFLVNVRPQLILPIAGVIAVQGAIALAQFVTQADLGLRLLGEPILDPTIEGTSVLWAYDRPWLRAYGLTAHPNVLGAQLAILSLLLLPMLHRGQSWQKTALALALAVSSFGLLATFSRAAWIAFALGLLAWFFYSARSTGGAVPLSDPDRSRAGGQPISITHSLKRVPISYFVLLVGIIGFLLLYRELAVSRFLHLDTEIESRSLSERFRDIHLALLITAQHPWTGVGAGNVPVALQALDADASVVHNVPLLVAAELGVPGLIFWVWLAVAPILLVKSRYVSRHAQAAAGSGAAAARAYEKLAIVAWFALLVVGLFDNSLWITASWRGAMLVALLLGLVAEGLLKGGRQAINSAPHAPASRPSGANRLPKRSYAGSLVPEM